MTTDYGFQDPTQPGTFKPIEWNGHLLLIEPHRYLEVVQTAKGPTDAIEGTVTVLTAQGGPHVIEQARLFQTALVSALRPTIGQLPTLGRLAQQMSQAGNAVWVLNAASPEDRQYAQQYLLSRPSVQSPAPVPVGPGPMANAYPSQSQAPLPAAPQVTYTQPQQSPYASPMAPPVLPQPQPVTPWSPQAQGPPPPFVQQAPPQPAPVPVAPPAAPQPAYPVAPVLQPQVAAAAPVGALTKEQIDALPAEVRAMLVGGAS